jgi:hypothetical protein
MAHPADIARMQNWLQGHAPVARTRLEFASEFSGVRKTDRAALDPKDIAKLQGFAVKGLEQKFERMDQLTFDKDGEIDHNSLKKVYNLSVRTTEFENALKEYDLDDVFQVPTLMEFNEPEDIWIPAPGAQSIDLFKRYNKVDLETVKHFSQFVALRGPRFMSQNLIWSGTKFLNSCSDDLRGKIEEATQGFPTTNKTGPVYFKIAMSMIMTVNAESIRVIDQALRQVKLSDFDGENVVEYNSTFRSLYVMLRNNDKLFGDELQTLTNGYCTSSTDEFNAGICVIFQNHRSQIKTVTFEDMFLTTEEMFNSLVSTQKWAGISNKKNESTYYFDGICNYCGKHGHKEADCWKKKKDMLKVFNLL